VSDDIDNIYFLKSCGSKARTASSMMIVLYLDLKNCLPFVF